MNTSPKHPRLEETVECAHWSKCDQPKYKGCCDIGMMQGTPDTRFCLNHCPKRHLDLKPAITPPPPAQRRNAVADTGWPFESSATPVQLNSREDLLAMRERVMKKQEEIKDRLGKKGCGCGH